MRVPPGADLVWITGLRIPMRGYELVNDLPSMLP